MTRRGLWIVLGVYAIVGLLLLGRLSLWLDEILYLIGARAASLTAMMQHAATNAGATPLGYVLSAFATGVFGDSAFSGRLPSLIASVCAGAGIFFLARRAGCRFPTVAVVLFLILPLQFRYALEARPYSAALCIAIWMTLAFLRLCDAPSIGRGVIYALLVAAGVYMQPFALFVAMAHVAWLVFGAKRTALPYALAALIAGAASFVPWYLYSSRAWHIEPAHFGFKEMEVIAKELVGAGYAGTAVMLVAAYLGLRSVSREWRVFWILAIALPIAGAVAADVAFHYFLAIRQMIFVLAPLAILAALGLERLEWNKAATRALATGLLIGCTYQNWYWFVRPREDWKAITTAVQSAPTSTCLTALPDDSLALYQYFVPRIGERVCPSDVTRYRELLVAIGPAESADAYQAIKNSLMQKGWHITRRVDFAGPRIDYYSRP